MLPLKLFKFGKRKENVLPISDTPISRLTKILSQTSFVEHSNSHRCDNVPLTSISEAIPADIDESANQEPPQKGFTTWHDSAELCGSSIPSSRPLLTREFSNSYSSGYYSSTTTTTQSAPPTCNIDRSQACPSTEQSSLPNSLSLFSEPYPGKVATDSSPTFSYKTLRRTQSCSRGWLAKRHRKQAWPRISGIMKPTTPGTVSPSTVIDTNSCPAALQTETAGVSPLVRCYYSLPPVGESCPSADSSPPPAENMFAKFSLSPINTSDEAARSDTEQVDLSASFHPRAKKLRTESPSRSLSSDAKPELNSTLPLEDQSMEEPEAALVSIEQVARPKPLFDMVRHQSTPMVPTRAISLAPRPIAPSPMPPALYPEPKPGLSRCVSVPVQNLSEKLNRCTSVLDNHNFRFEDRRPRALPVVDRTASGLHCVSTDTVAELVSEAAPKRNVRHVIVDCRFPYEYEGGHIQGAINIFTHSDLVQEIFNRVPAQRPPGASGPPRLLGEGLTRRLAMTLKEPLSAPCEPCSDDDSLECDEQQQIGEDGEDAFGQSTSFGDASDLELAGEASLASDSRSRTDDGSPSCRSEPDLSLLSQGSSANGASSQEPAFVVIFHCEFSSQRAPDLATFLRSIDRVSNYHRYPFLYFPEIYIMKGGYSAFYRKHAHLCCPQNYVKMFHRDYRTQLRLYKRLTKRVSSACLACIRPQQQQHQLIDPTGQPVTAATTTIATGSNDAMMNSFGQVFVPVTHPAVIAASVISANATAAANMPAPVEPSASTRARLAVIDSMMRGNQAGSEPQTGSSLVDDDENDKENRSPVSAGFNQMPPSSPVPIDLSDSSRNSASQSGISFGSGPVESPVSGRRSPGSDSSSSSSSNHNRTAFSDSPLSLAEVVVRVGRRVIAATLSSADPSAAKLLHPKFHQPSSEDGAVCEPRELKRRNTVNGFCDPRKKAGRRVPCAPIPFAVDCPDVFSDPNCCTQTTPAMGLKRAQTLQFTPVLGRYQTRSELQNVETPICPRQLAHPAARKKPEAVPSSRRSLSASPV